MNKKILLSMGSIVALAAPAISVISCGDEEVKQPVIVKSISGYDARITIPGQTLTTDGKMTTAELTKVYDEFKDMRGFKYVLRFVVIIPSGPNTAKRLIYSFQTPPTKAELLAKAATVVAEDIDPTTGIDLPAINNLHIVDELAKFTKNAYTTSMTKAELLAKAATVVAEDIDPTTGIDLPAINNLDIDAELAKFTKSAYATSMTTAEAQAEFGTKNAGFAFTPELTPITDAPSGIDQYTGISFILAQRYTIGDAVLHVTLKLTNLHDSRQEATKANMTINLQP